MKKPFFSIVIPTYNRAKDLQKAIAVCLGQTFRDFELIISDNASRDQTEKIVKAFRDKRIKYFKNKVNIGAANNYAKVTSYAKGEYLFTMGDDDFILFKNTLKKIKQVLDKRRWGFVRLNLLEKTLDGQGLRKSFITTERDFSIDSHSSPEEIFDFFSKTAASHLAGLVIKNRKNLSVGFMNCHDSPWIKPLYETIRKDGGFFLAGRYMIITWARGEGDRADISDYYDVHEDNRLMFENYTDFVFKQIPAGNLAAFKDNFYRKFIMLQPAIKLYSNNHNLIRFNRRFLELEPGLKNNPLFWLMAIMAFLLPKFIWETVRIIHHRQKNILKSLSNKEEILSRFAYLENRYFHA